MSDPAPNRVPELSLVMPCYNEAVCLDRTVPPLVEAFSRAGVALELVLVDNGSTDDTSAVIDRLIARGLPITRAHVPVNQGYGLGILTGLGISHGQAVGHIAADGQVAAEDVVKVYLALKGASGPALAKARRRGRKDGLIRDVISIGYNALMHVMFPGVKSRDINCNPKFMPADVLRVMQLASRDWFLEPEIMLKAGHLRLPVIEVDVLSLTREAGRSHVRLATVLEFIWNIAKYRTGGSWRAWRRRVADVAVSEAL